MTDKAATSLSQSKVIDLDLRAAELTDEQIERLVKAQLISVTVSNTAMSDKGLCALAAVPTMRRLMVDACPNIKDATVENLRKKYPKLHIGHQPAFVAIDEDKLGDILDRIKKQRRKNSE
jgi:hypothetical protein